MKKVYIAGGGQAYANMFRLRGWSVVDSIEESDLVQFTGGSDVSPALYQEGAIKETQACPVRDSEDVYYYLSAVRSKVPMAGICRGGQFLNIMVGGKMWQDVDGHAIYGTHSAITSDGRVIQVSSTHHQMMKPRPYDRHETVVLSGGKASTYKDDMRELYKGRVNHTNLDVEALLYKREKVLCFQPHPEFGGVEDCRDYYFELIEELLHDNNN